MIQMKHESDFRTILNLNEYDNIMGISCFSYM